MSNLKRHINKKQGSYVQLDVKRKTAIIDYKAKL